MAEDRGPAGSCVLDFSMSLQSPPQSHRRVHESLVTAAGFTHGTQLSETEAAEAAFAALDSAIHAFKHGPTWLHNLAFETAIMAMNVAMHAIHSTGAVSTPGPSRPSTPPTPAVMQG